VEHVREVALACRDVLTDHGIEGWPKTSGSRGMHIFCRIERRWSFVTYGALPSPWPARSRRGCLISPLALVERGTARRLHRLQPEREGPHDDQRLLGASTPDARVSAPLRWDEVPTCEAGDFTVATMPARFAAIGNAATASTLPSAI